MTPSLLALLTWAGVWSAIILAYVALRALWRRWTYRPERLRNAHYLAWARSIR